jgi:hypothetical protein
LIAGSQAIQINSAFDHSVANVHDKQKYHDDYDSVPLPS